MATVQLSCQIEGCGATWTVTSTKLMKTSMDAHRSEFHPNWVKPAPKAMSPYRLDYSGRARTF